jgi:hypothetical protein
MLVLKTIAISKSYIVVITARANSINDEGADFLDAGELRC